MKKFYVALHVKNKEQALQQAHNILFAEGAHGLILVNHDGNVQSKEGYPTLLDIADSLKKNFPKYEIGINPIDLNVVEAVKMVVKSSIVPDILWHDQSGIVEDGGFTYLDKNLVFHLRNLKSKYFGSIDFKGQPKPKVLKSVARIASDYFDVVVTSGKKTGEPPNLQKIIEIKSTIESVPLAAASGMSVDNLPNFIPFVDVFIVATSLNDGDFYRYDKEKVREFRRKLEIKRE